MRKLVFTIILFLLIAYPCFSSEGVGKPTSVELTIYNQNFALVKEVRRMSLEKGINFVFVPDVAAMIQPETVAFKSLTDPESVVVREQNYRYDLINPLTILNKSVGKPVKIRRYSGGTMFTDEGILLNPASVITQDVQPAGYGYDVGQPRSLTQYNGLVIRTEKGIILNPIGEVEVTELPEGLVSRPTLEWKIEATKPGNHDTEISYLANSINWKADYVAVVDALDKKVDITGWVTLDNKSGATYENATLNLMAGDVHRVTPSPRGVGAYAGYDVKLAMPEPQFTEKAFFEYHLYTLQGKTTVRDKETKQISLLSAAEVPAKKIYIYDGRESWWRSWRGSVGYRPGESYDVSTNKKVNVFVEFVNSKDNNLGIPLPKGTVRVYKQEADANRHFVGEDEIDHTPKDEKIRLYLGDAFDIVGEHKRTNFRRISDREVEESFEITIRNHKDLPVSVLVVEHLLGDWRIVESSHKYFKKDASTVEIPVEVPKNSELKIIYVARTRW
ncbi:MAG: hypothetical protein QHH26_09215 [Armatimonadota bacterium]|nr:hypothetical protein [Armatimonadota bacterium]